MFFLIGAIIIINAFLSTPETSIHQIYYQLQYITGILCIGVELIFWLKLELLISQRKVHKLLEQLNSQKNNTEQD